MCQSKCMYMQPVYKSKFSFWSGLFACPFTPGVTCQIQVFSILPGVDTRSRCQLDLTMDSWLLFIFLSQSNFYILFFFLIQWRPSTRKIQMFYIQEIDLLREIHRVWLIESLWVHLSCWINNWQIEIELLFVK